MRPFLKNRQVAEALTVLLLLGSVPFPAAASTGGGNLVFSDEGITVASGSTASGYEVNGTALTIKSAGTYILEGSCADGSVKVKKGTTGVRIVLNGLNLTAGGSETSATGAITCNKSTEVIIEAAEGTENYLEDSIYNNDDVYTENGDAENAVIKCKDGSRVTICGQGGLNITANGKNGIKSGATTEDEGTARLTIKELELNVAVAEGGNDAINAEQLLEIPSGKLVISAVDDAIHSDLALNIGAEGTSGPDITVTGCCEGIEAANLAVYSGKIQITSEDDCMNAANADLSEEDPDYAFSLGIYGGDLFLYSTDGDGIDSNGTLDMTGGNIEVWTANKADNQPLDSTGELKVKGATVFAAGGSSGAEALNLSSDSQVCLVFAGNSAGGGQQPGAQQPGAQQPGEQQPGEQQPGEQQPGEQQPGEQQPGAQQPGEQQPGAQQPGEQQPGEQQPGAQQPGAQQPGAAAGANITEGAEVSVLDAEQTEIYTARTAPCAASYVFFSSPELSSEGSYSLSNGATGSDASQNGGQPENRNQQENGNQPENGEPPAKPEEKEKDDSASGNDTSDSSTSDSSTSDSSTSDSSGSSGSSGGSSSGSSAGSARTVKTDTVQAPAGTLENGTWKYGGSGWTYLLSDGTKAANSWYPIKNPYAAAGQDSWGWYYFDKEGNMLTGWFTDTDGNRYYLDPLSDGQMGSAMLGWQKIEGNWYYFSMSTGSEHPTGSLYRSQKTPDGYVVDGEGKWVENS